MIVCSDRRLGFEFFKTKIGVSYSDDFRAMLFARDEHQGKTMSMDHVGAAFGFSNFVGRTASIHTVVQDPSLVTRSVLREVFSYAFQACGLEAVVATIDSANTRSAKFAQKIGGSLIHIIKAGGLDGDMLYFQMLKQDCRWIKEKEHGKRFAAAA